MKYIIILVAVAWFIIAAFKAIVELISNESQRITKANHEAKQLNLIKEKNELAKGIIVLIPNELEKTKAEMYTAASKLQTSAGKLLALEAPKRYATQLEFCPLKLNTFVKKQQEVLFTDISEILTPNIEGLSVKIDELIDRSCEYSCKFPAMEYQSLLPDLIQEVVVDLKEAELIHSFSSNDIDQARRINDLFKEELDSINEYNVKKNQLLAEISELNLKIRKFNKDLSKKSNQYLIDCKLIEANEKDIFESSKIRYEKACLAENEVVKKWMHDYQLGTREGVKKRIENCLAIISLPSSIPFEWNVSFDEADKIAIVEIRLPDVISLKPVKMVPLKKSNILKPLTKKELHSFTPLLHPSIMLRVGYEIYRNDEMKKIDLLVINGWVEYDDPKNGRSARAYIASLMVKPEEILHLNLPKLDPLAAYNHLKGISTGNINEIVPISPMLKLDTNDYRFVEAREVIDVTDVQQNLAVMDWQDFEHLIRELFEKYFSKEGAEVKITQASRDRGIDAVIFNHDPIKGGKIVVQAKRYSKTVDVSAVRDLLGAIHKEGAMKGILVTTSKFGPDSYECAKGTPITLINGSQLLGLFRDIGYTFRIDLEEAKWMNHLTD